MNNKSIVIVVGLVGLALLVAIYFLINKPAENTNESISTTIPASVGVRNTTYSIDDQLFTLVDGRAETPVMGESEAKIVTTYVGNEVSVDLNQDGTPDTALIISQETGGSGTTFYLVAALTTSDGYKGSRGAFLGDRIIPEGIRLMTETDQTGVLEVRILDRKEGEAFTVEPTIQKNLRFTFDQETLGWMSLDAEFKTEVEPLSISLTEKPWQWVRTNYTDGRVFVPKQTDAFVITFQADGTMNATTDCNGVGGEYTAVSDSFVFGNLATTMKYCEGSEEGLFNELLGQVSTYGFTRKNELELGLKGGEGVMILR